MNTRRTPRANRLYHLPADYHIELDAVSPAGRHLVPGTEVSIKGERGRFRFMRRVWRDDGREWLDFWGGPKHCYQWRSFTADRIRRVHRVVKTDQGVLEASKAGKAASS